MARMNICILGISELKWIGMGEFNSDDHCIYYCGQQSLRRNGVDIIDNKESKMKSLHAIQKLQDDLCSCPSQTIQDHTNTSLSISNVKEAKVKWFYEDLQDFLQLTSKGCPFHHRGLECKSGKSRDTWRNWQV